MRASGRNQDIAAVDLLPAVGRLQMQRHLQSGLATHAKKPGPQMHFDSFVPQQLQDGGGNIGIFATRQLRPRLQDGHPAAEPAIGLRQLQADIAPADDYQTVGQAIEVQRGLQPPGPQRVVVRDAALAIRRAEDIEQLRPAGEEPLQFHLLPTVWHLLNGRQHIRLQLLQHFGDDPALLLGVHGVRPCGRAEGSTIARGFPRGSYSSRISSGAMGDNYNIDSRLRQVAAYRAGMVQV